MALDRRHAGDATARPLEGAEAGEALVTLARVVGRLREIQERSDLWARTGDLTPDAVMALSDATRDLDADQRQNRSVLRLLSETMPMTWWWGWLRTGIRKGVPGKDMLLLVERVVLGPHLQAWADQSLWPAIWTADTRLALLEGLWERWTRRLEGAAEPEPLSAQVDALQAWRRVIERSLEPGQVARSQTLGRVPPGLAEIWDVPGAAWIVRDSAVLQPLVLQRMTATWVLRVVNGQRPAAWDTLTPPQQALLVERLAQTVRQALRTLESDEPTRIRSIQPMNSPVLAALVAATEQLAPAEEPVGPQLEALRAEWQPTVSPPETAGEAAGPFGPLTLV